jgi:hypothetical protein
VKTFKFDDTHVKTIGLGKSSNTDDINRVEILIYPPGISAPGAAAPRAAKP